LGVLPAAVWGEKNGKKTAERGQNAEPGGKKKAQVKRLSKSESETTQDGKHILCEDFGVSGLGHGEKKKKTWKGGNKNKRAGLKREELLGK